MRFMSRLFPFPPTIEARFIRRVNRFVAEVELADGTVIRAHTPNTGSLIGLQDPGNRVLLVDSANPRRKYRYSWKAVEVPGQWTEPSRTGMVWVSIDTLLPNRMVYELVRAGEISQLSGYGSVLREVSVEKGTRIDLQLRDPGLCHIEVKNVTLVRRGVAAFPDAVTARGLKHVQFMQHAKARGDRTVLVFTVQRSDGEIFSPAWDIDPDYSRALMDAYGQGVEIIPLSFSVTPQGVRYDGVLPFELNP